MADTQYKQYIIEFKLYDGTTRKIPIEIPMGEDGGFYTPATRKVSDTEIEISFTPSKDGMPAVEPVQVTLPAGTGSGGNVAYDEAQNLTDEQKAQARENIGAQPAGNYLTEVPEGYAKKTDIPSLDGYAKTTDIPSLEGYAKTEDVPTDAEIIQLIKNNAPESSGGGIAVTGATVGQTVKISAVDENGVPTAWEPTDFPSGGDAEVKEWEEFLRFTVDNEETTVFDFSSNGTETLESKRVKEFYIWSPITSANSAADTTASVLINNKFNITGLQYFNRPNGGYMKLGVFAFPESLSLYYFGRDSDKNAGVSYPASTILLAEKNGIFDGNLGSKTGHRNFAIEKDGIQFPFLRVDYIKTITVSLAAPCKSGIEFIVFVR